MPSVACLGGDKLQGLLMRIRLCQLQRIAVQHVGALCVCVQVAESMTAIWNALLDDPRAEVDKHFDTIVK